MIPASHNVAKCCQLTEAVDGKRCAKGFMFKSSATFFGGVANERDTHGALFQFPPIESGATIAAEL